MFSHTAVAASLGSAQNSPTHILLSPPMGDAGHLPSVITCNGFTEHNQPWQPPTPHKRKPPDWNTNDKTCILKRCVVLVKIFRSVPDSSNATASGFGSGLGRPVQSTLAGIIDKYLRFQHRAACMTSPCPVTTVPTLSLAFPHVLPVASRAMEAPVNATARMMRKEVTAPYGGRGEFRGSW